MQKLVTQWESTEPNPDEKMLKQEWQQEIDSLEHSVKMESEAASAKRSGISILLESANIKKEMIENRLKADREASDKSRTSALKTISKPIIDIEALHKQDLDMAKATAEKMKTSGNPFWQGYIWNASYGGYWKEFEGEREEIPGVSLDVAHNRFDPRAQAYGEGWFDSDYSRIHAYLAFRITPPSFGHLQIIVRPWLHGFYSLYSNDNWYKKENAAADMDTWVDLYQNFWRSRQYVDRFNMSGSELHPERSGRIDMQAVQTFFTNVGEKDLITIRVGVKLKCRGKASSGRASLDFSTGGANYVYVPYVYWYLHH